ncbi:MAG: hypothetical protein HKO65_12295 [Gemmatimonadetes bacterium]|nr:hypothetical protein [Gemmatimonadota bacterium]NNM05861.1 hypothetical protein [Gemmatimonadota bacterium]
MTNWLKRSAWTGLTALGFWTLLGCQEEIVAILEGDLVPVEAVTVEVVLPFHEFAENLEAWGGYGQPYQLTTDVIANAFEGSLDARVLSSWFSYPRSAQVRDPSGVVRTDTLLTFVGGRLVARFDTLSSAFGEQTELAVGALPQEWDFVTATWELAVDTVGERREWGEGGAGPVTPVSTAFWEPAQGDSVVFEIDSAGVALWGDSAGVRKGARLEALEENVRLELTDLDLWLITRPSVNPDTLVELEVATRSRTFVYSPQLQAPENEIRIGGVPAWRSVFTMNLPEVLNGPESLCQTVQCPLELNPESLVSASLVLTTRTPPPGFLPTDSLFLDIRPVLEPSRLPKSPLGTSLGVTLGTLLEPAKFGEEVGSQIEIQLGPYVQNLIGEEDLVGIDVPKTLALLSSFEPFALFLASFEGPDSPLGPELKLILTLADEVLIR